MKKTAIFKEAIADAQQVREILEERAREELKEIITPHLRNMLQAKLQEVETMDIEEDENIEEDSYETNFKRAMSETEADDDSEESEEEAEVGDEVDGLEGEPEEEEIEVADMEVSDLKDLIRSILAQELGTGEDDEMEGGEEELDAVPDELPSDDMVASDDEYDLNELLDSLEELVKEEEDEVVGEEVEEETSAQLAEAVKTIRTLQRELKEMNLFNSKLLYLNKVLKTQTLTESQKADVISIFDKVETPNEAKRVYETVLTQVGKKPSNKRHQLREQRGFASKPAGRSTQRDNSIIQVDPTIARMQKLAGINQ